MARIPEHEIERLKAEVAVERLVEASGVELIKKSGKDWLGQCPFHEDALACWSSPRPRTSGTASAAVWVWAAGRSIG